MITEKMGDIHKSIIHFLFALCLAIIFNGNCVYGGTCDAGWTLGRISYLYCFRVSSVAMTWDAAAKECRKYDAFLLRIYTQPSWQDIQALTNTTYTTRWWTGLNDKSDVGTWVFDTGAYSVSTDMAQISFLTEPDDTNHHENCGALTYQGSVTDERCNDRHRYICEYKPPPGKACQQSWSNFTTGCYLFPFGLEDPFSMLTWTAAKTKCQGTLAGTSDSNIQPHLLSIETQDELKYVRSTLPQVSMTSDVWWIGMTDVKQEGSFVWTDGSPVNNQLIVWAQEPNNLGGQERCGYINRVGQYGDLNCNNKENYICMKETADATVFPALGCPGSWTRAGYSCYLMQSQTKKSWQDAKTACQQAGAQLLSVDDLDEKNWIEAQNPVYKNGYLFWTGLNYVGNKQWQWSDGRMANVSLLQWNIEPNNYNGNEDCAALNRKGYLNDVSCLLKKGFICEMNTEDAPCPSGWYSRNAGDQTNCFYISNMTASFDEAHSQCNQLAFPVTAYLAAFNSKEELTFLQQKIAAQPASNIYEWFTGLQDSGHEGFWTYDTSFNPQPDPSTLPWGRMPTFKDGDENCAAIILGAQYINMKCKYKLPYVCEKLAAGVSVPSRGSRIIHTRFSASSVFVLLTYFIVYAICLHYILHLTYILSPSYVYV